MTVLPLKRMILLLYISICIIKIKTNLVNIIQDIRREIYAYRCKYCKSRAVFCIVFRGFFLYNYLNP